MFYGEIRIKQGLSYISFCPLRILYNSKFILMATSLGTNTVSFTRVHCICSALKYTIVSSDSVCGQQRSCADALADLVLCCQYMPKDTFSNGAADTISFFFSIKTYVHFS